MIADQIRCVSYVASSFSRYSGSPAVSRDLSEQMENLKEDNFLDLWKAKRWSSTFLLKLVIMGRESLF